MKKTANRKKRVTESDDEMRPEYDIRGADLERGKFYRHHMENSNVVVLAPDVFRVFRGPKAVNKALRSLIREKKAAAG